jgi:hypothetical protein
LYNEPEPTQVLHPERKPKVRPISTENDSK